MNEFDLNRIKDKKVKNVDIVKTKQTNVIEITFDDDTVLSFIEWVVIYDGWFYTTNASETRIYIKNLY